MGVTEDTQGKFELESATIETGCSPFCEKKIPKTMYWLCSVLHNMKLKVSISNSEAANRAKCW